MSTTIAYAELVGLLEKIFLRHGTDRVVASILAENCAMCERDGAYSHGIFRMPGYVASLNTGWVDGRATPEVEDVAPSFCRVDARNGFAQAALARGRDLAISKSRQAGISVLAIRNSHHLSALWPDIEPFAREGLIAISAVNSFACTVPFDGKSAVFGTNPFAFAAPVENSEPMVFDLATSAMANGDVQIAARKGHTLPPDSGVDGDGKPTNDPRAVLDGGALLTFGGYKGSSISMMVELLGAALTGGHFSFEFDWSGHQGAQTPHTGQLIILIDPSYGAGEAFDRRAHGLITAMQAAGVSRLPGQRRAEIRAQTAQNGIPITEEDLASLRTLAIA
ncbi:Ldh family oxidoreductase [Pelagibacterium halotolerans]|uniref:Delta(1)-pyrroline-2-carboxylate/Delta(1)-piperideine-2-carboxylate reductase n=1 Tax=Pelagibacterium halotolerans (strain DSM 22347 / JCM 15775 / CGMCC 1.7692 / B2) TaxID=1082931 RepID=G4R797_PELHB|nr:Ldh family oxidoreductase [Pelagibacterium halotolerans]AEQ51233.1 delta 1-piperideine-2-carboxylate reductase / delta 1-pyrroline-2-carboxylate reductase [Pelagibacterium halotolerans B2]SEA67717.1 delta1-piperideine 2-carboxylate reductase [Pelagibacterium halotolerans]